MRKILFKKWIPAVYPEGANSVNVYSRHRPIAGNCWEADYTHHGTFHQWANAIDERDSGAVNYTVAMVELPDGTMIEVLPTNIKFTEPWN